MAAIQFLSFKPPSKPSHLNTMPSFKPLGSISLSITSGSKSISSSSQCHFHSKRSKFCSASLAFSCSTTPFIGRMGLQSRQGNASLLSFGFGEKEAFELAKPDVSQTLSALLPFVVAATAVAALVLPSTFTWVPNELYAPALGGIMLSIGIRMSVDDFALALQRPLPLSVGFLAQYVLKPALGVLIARAFRLPQMFCAGFVLMTCVAGAQLSSYATFLSKGDVALSILLTSCSTIASVLVTPLLTGFFIGSIVPVDPVAMSKSILQVVLVPVTFGLVLNTYAKPVVNILRPVMPFIAMVCTSVCIGSPLSINQKQILSAEGSKLMLPVLMFHTVAFTLGYWVSKIPIFRQEEEASRTISLSTGMQSSTLAGLLATQFLGASQAVPPACSVVAMAIMGLSLASFWGTGCRIRDLPSLFLSRKQVLPPRLNRGRRKIRAYPARTYGKRLFCSRGVGLKFKILYGKRSTGGNVSPAEYDVK